MRVPTAIAILLCLSISVFAQDSLNISQVGALYSWTWDQLEDVVVQEPYAYIASGNSGLRVVDISDRTSPVEVGIYNPSSFFAECVAVAGAFAYVGGDHMHIVDISDPINPQAVGYAAAFGLVSSVAVRNGYAYLTEASHGHLRIFDISDPSQPQLIRFLSLGSSMNDIVLSEGYAYVAQYSHGLRIIDISDPSTAYEIGSNNSPTNAEGVAVIGGLAFVANGSFNLKIFDISDPSDPTEIGSLDTPGSSYSVEVAGNYLYLSNEFEGMYVIDISDPELPLIAGFYDSPGRVYNISVTGEQAVVADFEDGLRIVDIGDPTTPVEIGFLESVNGIKGVNYSDGYAYIWIYEDGMRVLDVSDPSLPVEVGRYDSPDPRDLTLQDTYAYLVDDNEGLLIIDISDPTAPFLAASFGDIIHERGITVAGDYAYVLRNEGILILDISNPLNPIEMYAREIEYPTDIEIVGNLAYLFSRLGLSIIDVSDMENPGFVGFFHSNVDLNYDLVVSGGYAYLAQGDQGFRIIDVSDPTAPFEIVHDTRGRNAQSIDLIGDFLYTSSALRGVHIFDVSEPQFPARVGYFNSTGNTQEIDVADEYAFVADQTSFVVLDCSRAITPLIEITLSAADPLIVPQGGSIEYGALLVSNLPSPLDLDIWTRVKLPDGTWYGPLLEVYNYQATPETVIEIPSIFQTIPINAPLGTYTYSMQAGDFPRVVVGKDSFSFEVVASAGIDAWNSTVWKSWGYETKFIPVGESQAMVDSPPTTLQLSKSHPNPFNPSTSFSVTLPQSSDLTVIVYNVTGRQVAELANGQFNAGSHSLTFDASGMASGLYFVRATVPGELDDVQKVMLVR
jgi:hypothetical protein